MAKKASWWLGFAFGLGCMLWLARANHLHHVLRTQKDGVHPNHNLTWLGNITHLERHKRQYPKNSALSSKLEAAQNFFKSPKNIVKRPLGPPIAVVSSVMPVAVFPHPPPRRIWFLPPKYTGLHVGEVNPYAPGLP